MDDLAFKARDGQTRQGLAARILTAIILGIPMTVALAIALVFYCAYEFLKFAVTKGFDQQHPLSATQDRISS